MDAPSPRHVATQRWDAIDVARGAAIVAMVVYHFSWDLSYLKLIVTNTITDPGWKWFARSIAGSFLLLVGMGLALAHGAGLRHGPFLYRLAKVGGAALAVTLVTFYAFPASYIFFGILHCIAVASVLALPFLRVPWPLTALAAAACLAAPRLLTSPALDQPALDWLGLGAEEPITNDYVPIFPWLGVVLAGVILGRALLHRREALALARWRAAGPLPRALAWAGRRSLPIYLIHQPVLFAVLYGVLQITGPNPAAEAAPFIRQCAAGCVSGGRDQALCEAVCGCTAERAKQEGLWRDVLRNEVAPPDRIRVNRMAQQCLVEQARPAP